MEVVSSFLPVTVLSAFGIFFVKEISEYLKKRNEKKRKISAYKMLLAEEIMKNAWAVKTLQSCFSDVGDDLFIKAECQKTEFGPILITIYTETSEGGSSLPVVHTSLFDKVIVDLAVIDGGLFDSAKKSYEALADVENCREQLYRYITEGAEENLSPLSSYALEKLKDAEEELKKFYRSCTNKDLTTHKVRSFVR